MDTKLKNYSHSIWVKILLFALVIFFFTNSLMVVMEAMVNLDGNPTIIFEDDYLTSDEFTGYNYLIQSDLYELVSYYKSEDYIKDKENISSDELESMMLEYYHRDYNELDFEEYYEKYPEKIEEVEDIIVENKLSYLNDIQNRLDGKEGIRYYTSQNDYEFTNTGNDNPDDYRKYPVYSLYGDNLLEFYPDKDTSPNFRMERGQELEGYEMYLAYTEDFINKESAKWQANKIEAEEYFKKAIINFSLLFITFIIYILLVGRKYWGDKEVSLGIIDKLYTDINILICMIPIFLWIVFGSRIGFYSYQNNSVNENSRLIFMLVTAGLGSLGLILVTSLIKHIKNRSFIGHSLVFSIFGSIFKSFKEIYNSSSLGKKLLIFLVVYPILVRLHIIFLPIIIALGIYLGLEKIKDFENIQEGTRLIREGELDHKIEVESEGELKILSENINSISEGLENAIENELKSERMKSELITNVSHDIRTPLTSIITYIDLLEDEEDQVKRQEYIGVLSTKSERLKKLIDDLFEASKATSGTIDVNLEKIDLLALLSQGLGEFNDRIEEKKLDIIVDGGDIEEAYVEADGGLIWRSLENLLSNILKYSLEGSRVYIDVEDGQEYISITMKNISAYRLNISEEELMERFKRGDESRTSQGSGLGLSITESLIELQGGEFDIEIDGDLFKSIIKLKKH